ncbi:MAG: histidine phosphatase family protein [Alphaproteobacteria bacterium]
MKQTILTLIRHGQTSANTGGVWHGSTDTPLSEHGRDQAARVARGILSRFRPAAIYASNLQRALHTALAIAEPHGMEVVVDLGLREFDLGSWEGRTYRELWDKEDLWRKMKHDPDFAPHGGESPREVTDRLVATLQKLAASHPGERIVCVSHGGAMSMALGHILEGDYSEWTRLLDNCAVAELVLEPEPTLLSFNESWE